MRERFVRFMAGRYGGNDLLNKTLMVSAFVLIIVQILLPGSSTAELILSLIAWGLIILYTFRTFSRNINRRVAENYAYYTFVQRLRKQVKGRMDMFRQRKTHRFIRCPNCKNTLRVPKGKGKINIHCRQCGHSFISRT